VETRPLSPHLGAEILDLDVREVTKSVALDIGALLLRHGILLLRKQDITATDQVRFTQHFGELERFPVRSEQGPGAAWEEFIFRVSNDSRKGYRGVGLYWHTDGYFHERPTAISLLRAVTVPLSGGDTCFANMGRAFETLPVDLREKVRALTAVSRPAPGAQRSGGLFTRSSATGVHHPLVRPHPLTKEPTLYLNVSNMAGIEGLGAGLRPALKPSPCASYIVNQRYSWRRIAWPRSRNVLQYRAHQYPRIS